MGGEKSTHILASVELFFFLKLPNARIEAIPVMSNKKKGKISKLCKL